MARGLPKVECPRATAIGEGANRYTRGACAPRKLPSASPFLNPPGSFAGQWKSAEDLFV